MRTLRKTGNLRVVQNILGHTDITITAKFYTGWPRWKRPRREIANEPGLGSLGASVGTCHRQYPRRRDDRIEMLFAAVHESLGATNRPLRMPATPLGFEAWNNPVALQV